MFIYLASLSLSCNHLFITVLSCLSCCTCCLCISICQHLSLSLCFCVVSITVTIIYLSNIYLYLICLLQSFSLPHSLSLRLSQPQYIYLTYPCDILFHGLFLSIYLFSGSLHFFSLCFSVSYSIIVFLADSIISFVFLLPFWHWRTQFKNTICKRHAHETRSDLNACSANMHTQPAT